MSIEQVGIDVKVDLDTSKAEAKIKGLEKSLTNKSIPVRLNDTDIDKFSNKLDSIQAKLGNAFKLSGDSLKGLNTIKETVTLLNSLDKQLQKGLLSGGTSATGKSKTDYIGNQIKLYEKLHNEIYKLTGNYLANEEKGNSAQNTVIKERISLLEKEANLIKNNLISSGKLNSEQTRKLNTYSPSPLLSTELLLPRIQDDAIRKQQSELVTRYGKLQKELNDTFKTATKSSFNSAEMEQSLKVINKLSTELGNLKSKMNDSSKNKIKVLDTDNLRQQEKIIATTTDKISTNINKLQERLGKVKTSGLANSSMLKEIAQLERIMANLSNKRINVNSGNAIQELIRCTTQTEKLSNRMSNLELKVKDIQATKSINDFKNKSLKALQEIENRFGKQNNNTMFTNLKNDIQNIDRVPLNNLKSAMADINKRTKELTTNLRNVRQEQGMVGKFFTDLSNSFRSITLGNMLGSAINTQLRDTITTIKDADKAMVDLKKVLPTDFNINSDSLDEISAKARQISKDVARASNDVIIGTARALQSGANSVDEALEISSWASKFANVGDVTQEASAKYIAGITSAFGGLDRAMSPVENRLKGMNEEYSNMEQMLDIINYSANNYAISAQQMSEMFLRSASAVSSTGMTYEELASMGTAIHEITQNAETSGRALKSMSLNMNMVKANAKTGEKELTKTGKALQKMGIEIFTDDTKTKARSFMEVMKDVNKSFESWSDTDKAYISEAIAGKEFAVHLQALISNWGTVEEMMQDFSMGKYIGSVNKENDRFIDSVEGRIVELKENLKDLKLTIADGDTFKGLLSGTSGVLSSFTKIVSTLQEMNILLPAILGTSSFFKNMNSVKSGNGTTISRGVNSFRQQIADIKNMSVSDNLLRTNMIKTSKVVNQTGSSYKVLSNSIDNTAKSQKVFNSSTSTMHKGYAISRKAINLNTDALVNNSKAQAQTYRTGLRVSTQQQNQLAQMTTSAQFTSNAITKATQGIKGFAMGIGSSLLTGFALTAITTAMSVVVKKANDYIKRFENKREEIQSNINSASNQIVSTNNTISQLKELSKAYDELNSKTERNEADEENLLSIRRQIAEISPELVTGYDENNNPIVAMGREMDNLIAKYELAIEKQNALMRKEQIALGQNARDELQTGKNKNYEDYKKSLNLINNNQGMFYLNDKKHLDNIKNINKKNYKEEIENFGKYEKEKNRIIESSYREAEELYSKHQDTLSEIRGEVNARVEDDLGYSKLTDNAKNSIKELNKNLDFSSLDDASIKKFSKNLVGDLTTNTEYAQKSISKLTEAYAELEKTGQVENYENSVKKLIPELSRMTGLTTEQVEALVKTPEIYKQAQSSLDKYLMTFGKREQMKGFDLETKRLVEQFENVQNIVAELGNGDNYEVIDGEVVLKASVKEAIIDDKNTPKAIREAMSVFEEDGAIDVGELFILTQLTTEMQNGKLDEDFIDNIQKMLDAQLGDKTFDIKPLLRAFNEDFDITQQEEIINSLIEKYKEIPEEVKTAIITDKINSEEEAEKLLKFYNEIPKEIKTIISSNGVESVSEIEQVVKQYNELPQEIKTVLKAENITNLSDINGLIEKYNTIPEDIRTKLQADGVELTTQSIDNLAGIYRNYPKEVATKIILENGDAILKAKSVEEFLNKFKSPYKAKVDVEVGKTPTKETILGKIGNLFNKPLTVQATTSGVSNASREVGELKNRTQDLNKASSGTKKINVLTNAKDKAKELQSTKTAWDNIKSGTKTLTIETVKKNKTINTVVNNKDNYYDGQSLSIPAVYDATTVATDSITTFADNPTNYNNTNYNNTTYNNKARAWENPTKTHYSGIDWITRNINYYKQLEERISRVSAQLDILNSKMEYTYGAERVKLIQEQIELLQEQEKLQKSYIEGLDSEAQALKKFLSGQGIKFDDLGNITNYKETLDKLNNAVKNSKSESAYNKNSKILSEMNSALDRYISLINNEIPNANKDIIEMNNSIKDLYKEQLETTKTVEDKITSIIKKEVEERKKLIDEELDKKLDAIEKQKKAYNDSRDSQDFEKQVKESQDEIAKLQQQIALASRDTSKAGQIKLKDLIEQLTKEQENLADIMQDNTDKIVNDLFDNQKDLLKEQADKEKENLDAKYSDENIKQIVKDTILSGQFTDINGEVKKLEDVLISFVDKYEDGLTAVGQIVKNELLANLETSYETMKNLSEIIDKLGLETYGEINASKSRSLTSANMISLDLSSLTSSGISTNNLRQVDILDSISSVNISPVINFNDSLLRVEGNVTKDSVSELNYMIKEAEKRITQNIVNAIR